MEAFYNAMNQLLPGLAAKALQRVKRLIVSEVHKLERISNNIGMNAEVCQLIYDWCQHLQLDVELITPSSSAYSNLTADEFFTLTGVQTKKSHQHVRSAAGLILADVPIQNPLTEALTGPGELSPYQRRVQQAMLKGLLNQQLKKNQRRRRLK